MLDRTLSLSRFITSDIPNTQTKVTPLITETRSIEASCTKIGTCFYGAQNGEALYLYTSVLHFH